MRNIPMTNEELDRLARKRACAKLGWYQHAAVYALINAFLITLSLWQDKHWAMFPLLGWGLGLAIHGFAVWFAGAGSALRESMVARERARLSAQRDAW
jgi:2TM domain